MTDTSFSDATRLETPRGLTDGRLTATLQPMSDQRPTPTESASTDSENTEPQAADQYHDGNERDIAAKQERPDESAAFDDAEIDSAKVRVLPGTGGPDDVGDTEAEPDDYNRTGH